MSNVVIYHNPRCSKSRQTLALLEEKGVSPRVVEYLKDVPTKDDIARIIVALGEGANQIVRTKEPVYKELGLSQDIEHTALVDILVDNPILIERPIVVNGSKAAIGRPPEAVLSII